MFRPPGPATPTSLPDVGGIIRAGTLVGIYAFFISWVVAGGVLATKNILEFGAGSEAGCHPCFVEGSLDGV